MLFFKISDFSAPLGGPPHLQENLFSVDMAPIHGFRFPDNRSGTTNLATLTLNFTGFIQIYFLVCIRGNLKLLVLNKMKTEMYENKHIN